MEKKTVYLDCECGSHSVKFSSWVDEGDIGIDYFVSAFVDRQARWWEIVWRRLSMAVSLLWKGEFFAYELYVEDKEAVLKIANLLMETYTNSKKKPIEEKKITLDIQTVGTE